MKIRTKLQLLALFAILMVAIMSVVICVRIATVTTSIANDDALAMAKNHAELIDVYINGLVNIGDNAAPIIADMIQNDADGTSDEELASIMRELLKANEDSNVLDVYIGLQSNGRLISGAGFVPDAAFDARERPWFSGAATAGRTTISEPYLDADTGKAVVSVSSPMRATDGSLLGVFAADVTIDSLAASVLDAKVLGDGYGTLIGKDGTILAHPHQNFVMKENIAKPSSVFSPEIVDVGRRVLSTKSGTEDFSGDKQRMRLYYAHSKTGFIAAVICPVARVYGVVGSIVWVQALVAVVMLIMAGIWIGYLIVSIGRPLRIVENTLARIAGFDLTIDPDEAALEASEGHDTEIGRMLASLSRMRSAWNGVVRSVRTEVGRTSATADRLDTLAEGARNNVNDTANAIGNVDNLANTALESLRSTTDTIQDVSAAASRNSGSASEVAEAAREMANLSRNVQGIMTAFVDELRGVGSNVMKNSEGMNVVGSSVESITEFVGTIEGIASQTNLLALNAAIEAARAGEAGRGFAVVAEEVRHLAEESNEASQRVAELIESLGGSTSSAIESTKQSAGVISTLVDKAIDALGKLNEMIAQIERMTTSVQTIALAAQEQTESSQDVAESASSVRANVENVVSEISAVAGSTGGTVSAMRDVSSEALRLAEISRSLSETMQGFKTE